MGHRCLSDFYTFLQRKYLFAAIAILQMSYIYRLMKRWYQSGVILSAMFMLITAIVLFVPLNYSLALDSGCTRLIPFRLRCALHLCCSAWCSIWDLTRLWGETVATWGLRPLGRIHSPATRRSGHSWCSQLKKVNHSIVWLSQYNKRLCKMKVR